MTIGRWMTMVGNRNSGSGLTAAGILADIAVPFPCILQTIKIALLISAPNDASNYWSISLTTAAKSPVTFTTATLAASGWRTKTVTNIRSPVTEAADILMYLYATKVGSPGALYWSGPVVLLE